MNERTGAPLQLLGAPALAARFCLQLVNAPLGLMVLSVSFRLLSHDVPVQYCAYTCRGSLSSSEPKPLPTCRRPFTTCTPPSVDTMPAPRLDVTVSFVKSCAL